MISAGLRARVTAWTADDPDESDRAELAALLAASDEPGPAGAAAQREVADRFAGRLEFGTAGLRGAIAAGPNRMNRAVVRATTAALAAWLLARDRSSAARGVVVGCDARHRSEQFATEVACVLAGAGIAVHLLPAREPTPLLAFAVRRLGAAAGVMVTASHNPPQDNGYKLYLADGAQIIPPADAEITARIAALGPLLDIPVTGPEHPLITHLGDEVAQAYLDSVTAPYRASATAPQQGSVTALAPLAGDSGLCVVYTSLHGVAASLMLRAAAAAGFGTLQVVAAQAEPDADFPTVAFPNPEEPGALDLALAEASKAGADLVLANDPDGDRLAVAVPDPAASGGWRRLTGDQVGALLGAWVLECSASDPDPGSRLVATTIVSSTLLSKVAQAAGADFAETLTGFKWIVRARGQRSDSRFVFGYEEALGYDVGDVVRDKDGIGAALAVLSLVSTARARGQSLPDRWDALEVTHGVHLTSALSLATSSPAQIMASLRADPPATLAGEPVTSVNDLDAPDATTGLPRADVLVYRLPGGRAVVRPSGTEPKLKAYLEVVEPLGGRSLADARAAAAARLGPLRTAVETLVTR
ncbi:MAG TPA: phospho-sugar mutase [Streptosporangiaceae bacterium]|nr:phospho-sugar mutase [Streptosporangiaceae bacterium]